MRAAAIIPILLGAGAGLPASGSEEVFCEDPVPDALGCQETNCR